MVNKRFFELAKRQMNNILPKDESKSRKTKPSSSGLTQILQRDENGKPKLSLNCIKKTAVNTQTQEDYWGLMRVYECGGWRWAEGHLPTQNDYWDEYKEKNCISAGVDFPSGIYNEGKFGYDYRGFYEEGNWKIISPQKFNDVQKITPDMLKEINIWFSENGK